MGVIHSSGPVPVDNLFQKFSANSPFKITQARQHAEVVSSPGIRLSPEFQDKSPCQGDDSDQAEQKGQKLVRPELLFVFFID